MGHKELISTWVMFLLPREWFDGNSLKPCSADTSDIWLNWVNIVPADALSSDIAKISPGMMMTK